jgi:cell division protein FtsZ
MTNELRVTVVATGLGVAKAAAAAKEVKAAAPTKVIDNTRRPATPPVDYAALDRPAHLRANAHSSNAAALAAPLGDKELEYLDIPAFLRRQAD